MSAWLSFWTLYITIIAMCHLLTSSEPILLHPVKKVARTSSLTSSWLIHSSSCGVRLRGASGLLFGTSAAIVALAVNPQTAENSPSNQRCSCAVLAVGEPQIHYILPGADAGLSIGVPLFVLPHALTFYKTTVLLAKKEFWNSKSPLDLPLIAIARSVHLEHWTMGVHTHWDPTGLDFDLLFDQNFTLLSGFILCVV